MSTYRLSPNRNNWRLLEASDSAFLTEEGMKHQSTHYLVDEWWDDENGKRRHYYRFKSTEPHTIEEALAYDLTCPKCHHTMKQVGKSLDRYELGLYTCLDCDKRNNK